MWTTALLISILRLTVRYWNLKRLFWDYAFAISAMIWLTVMATLNQLSCNAIYLMEALAEGRTPSAPFLTPDQIMTSRYACAAHLSRAFYCQFNARLMRLGGLEVGDEGSILTRDRIVRTYKAKAQKYNHTFREQHPELLGSNSRVKRAVLCYCHDGKE